MSLIHMLAKKRKLLLPTLFHQRSQMSLSSHQVQNFQHKLSQVIYVPNQMHLNRKTSKGSKVCLEEILKKKTVCGGELLCNFTISPDIYFLPALARCLWCFLLVYKLNMVRSYPKKCVCLEQNKF